MRSVYTVRFCLAACLMLVAIGSFSQKNKPNLLAELIERNKSSLGEWADNPEKYSIQVIYTQIDRDEQNRPFFTSYTWGGDPKRYFYPASTVKMPAAFLALEKLNNLYIKGLHKYTPLRIGAASQPQTPVVTDTSAANSLPSLAHYIKKIFIVSDNDAFNRMYEWLGQAALNEGLWEKGYKDLRLLHRLAGGGFDASSNRYTNPFTLYNYDTVFYYQGEVESNLIVPKLGLSNEYQGKGYIDNNEQLVDKPFDFSGRNYISLQNLHDMLRAVMFPDAVSPQQRFNLSDDDYRFLYQCMSEWPRESKHPHYHYADNYVKFWMYGDSTLATSPNVRIFNKVGLAYGYLSDIAYIADFESGTEFMLSGVILVNEDQIFNDGEYEYNAVGMPFFSKLGKLIFDFEKQRKRPYKPDLSRFLVKYD